MVNIQVRISGENLAAYRADLRRLKKELLQLQSASPFKFTIIGSTAGDASKIRMVRKPTFRDVSSVLNVAHQDIYTANPKGQAFRQRVEAASGPIQMLREKAVQDFLKNQKPVITTRASARQEYAVAKALFSPGFIIQ